MVIGVIILIVGVFSLLENLGLISGSIWNIIWPVALIAIGLRIILRRNDRWHEWHQFGGKMHDKSEHENL